MTIFKFFGFAAFLGALGLSACAMQAPAPVSRSAPPAVIFAPEPAPEPIVVAPAPVPLPPAPDYTTLPGHSSVTTPVPVEPVDVEGLGPVIP